MGVAAPPLEKKPWDRSAALERLFALPVPPPPSPRRTYPIDTPLGRIMRLKGLTVRDVSRMDGAPIERTMTEILAGRADVGPWRTALARGLGVDARVL